MYWKNLLYSVRWWTTWAWRTWNDWKRSGSSLNKVIIGRLIWRI